MSADFGNNLVRLRGEGVDKAIPDEAADLIYLDPPFNSARNYDLLFRQHKGQDSLAPIMHMDIRPAPHGRDSERLGSQKSSG